MDVLVPWIVATVERELSEALRHWGKGTNDYQPVGKSRGLPYDDGSNLRIPSGKEGPVVQITKVGNPSLFFYTLLITRL